MTTAGHVELSKRKLDAIAWKFLGSEFTGKIYADWPIDRRVYAFLRRDGLIEDPEDEDGADDEQVVGEELVEAHRVGDSGPAVDAEQ